MAGGTAFTADRYRGRPFSEIDSCTTPIVQRRIAVRTLCYSTYGRFIMRPTGAKVPMLQNDSHVLAR